MIVELNGLKIHFKVSGQGRDLLLLHGWGAELSAMRPLHKHYERFFKTYSLDLPGFGLSDPPPRKWGVAEYAGLVSSFLQNQGIKSPIMLGHSFGGKISIYMAAEKYPIRKLILVDSAGVVPPRSASYYVRVYAYKTARYIMELPGLKRVFAQRLERIKSQAGSEDYRRARGVMRETLVKVVNQDLTSMMSKIDVPTLLVWGVDDTATPVADGRLMEQLIPTADLVELENAGHYSYLDCFPRFVQVTGYFLKEDMESKDD